MKRFDMKEVVGGVLMCLAGAYFMYGAFGYSIGTPRRMGPGFFPLMLSIGAILSGLAIIMLGFRHSGALPAMRFRAMAAVLGSILAFGVAFRFFGLLPAVVATVTTASLGDSRSRPAEVLALAAAAAAGAWLIFIVALGLQLPAIRGWG